MNTQFEDYTSASRRYAEMRAAVSWEHILQQLENPLEAHILDAGCGTGNYVLKLAPNVKRVTGIDLNEGMLQVAKNKLQNFPNVDFKQGSLNDPLPFESQTFDLVTCNQVIHHLWKDGDFSLWPRLVSEFHRVLKPGGKVVLNISSLDQLQSYWFIRFFPEILTRFSDRVIPKDLLINGFEIHGMKTSYMVDKSILYGDNYYNISGIFHSEWRKMSSYFRFLEDEELVKGLEKIRSMMNDGTVFETLNEAEQLRQKNGFSNWFVAQKSL